MGEGIVRGGGGIVTFAMGDVELLGDALN